LPEEDAPKVCEVTDEEADAIRSGRVAEQERGTKAAQAKPTASADKDAIWTDKDFKKDVNNDDEYEEYVPDVRDNPGKIGMRFSVRPRPGVPVRDRGQREPPRPKNMVKSEVPPMLAGDEDADEADPVWLKDKADNLMVAGDYQGAYNAYTEALKLGIHPYAFANRSVADLYLGNLEQCIEDCNRAIAVFDKRNAPAGGCGPSGPVDPQDAVVRTRCEIRLGTAFLWLGAFKKAEDHFQKAIDTEDGLDYAERKQLKEDLVRVQSARAALMVKEKADGAARRAHGSDDLVQKELGVALEAYEEALKADPESAVVYANRCFANLRAGKLKECVEDADEALKLLKQWPAARQAPKPPARPAKLNPPMLEDPTFLHPDQQKQGEVDWLMKHCGGDSSNLPPLPPEYEWVKDVAEKTDNAWIAIRKKMSKATRDSIRESTKTLQEALYSRSGHVIRDHIRVALELNKVGEGPSDKAIKQAEDYAGKVEQHAKEEEEKRLREEAAIQQEIEEYDLEEALDPTRTGVARAGFARGNPVCGTQRRLFAKVLLRRARAHELLGNLETAAGDLKLVRRVEPENREAKHRLASLQAALAPRPEERPPNHPPDPPAEPATASLAANTSCGPGDEAGGGAASPLAGEKQNSRPITKQTREAAGGLDDIDDDEDDQFDHAATTSLLQSAADYMRRNDYQGALQIYNYVRRRCKVWESPVVELKVLSNTSLCLQRLRGRLPELVKACSEALRRIEEIRTEKPDDVAEDMLLNMECAVLSRRGNAYSQQQMMEESNRDAARVKELLGRPA
jgi:tetratricopeptide (TPR) repeat protein